ncbi:MAG: hypothetical protein IT353_23475 [Gemmatimonadaceae bacterium]|nr:hypothetical protein [Gemmatimonadaceae bacterium]
MRRDLQFVASAVGAMLALAPLLASAQQPAVPRWQGAVDLTIGGESGVGNADLSRVSGIAVDASGRIFIADSDDQQIRVFSSKGAPLASFGRKGSGPLEFKGLRTIGFGPDQRLWVRDEGNVRMMTFDVSAFPVTTSTTAPLGLYSGGSQIPITFERSGERVDEKTWFDERTEVFRPLRVRVSSTGTVLRVDTLAIPSDADAGVYTVTNVQRDASRAVIGMRSRIHYQPFGPRWIRAYGPNGMRADVVGSTYAVRIFDGAGKVVRTLSRTVPPVPLSAVERQKADSQLKAMPSTVPFGMPRAKAPVVGLHWSLDGALWVERAMADGQPREADVFDASGKLIAIAVWPRAINLMSSLAVIRGKTGYAAAFDESDLPSVVRLVFR